MAGRVENINKDILRQCREQIGLSLPVVAKKVAKIAVIEQGDQKPTFKQLDTLAELYKVPRWVFISEHLPEKYQFARSIPVFRQFADKNADIFSDYKVRSLTTKVERFRELILELYDDINETVAPFNPPDLKSNLSIDLTTNLIRDWLGAPTESYPFTNWKEMLEEQGVFVFMTSKYKGWSHIDKKVFRGLAVYHSTLPIIIVNDSDANKAQSFTLFHELGHLLRKESAIDNWDGYSEQVEKWCDEFSGNLLMPTDQIRPKAQIVNDLDDVKNIAKQFNVSSYACLVRLRQLNLITQSTYNGFEAQLKNEYRERTKKMKDSPGGPSRNRPKEVFAQYGRIYSRAIFQAYYNQDLGLKKLCQLFDLKRPSYALELEGQI